MIGSLPADDDESNTEDQVDFDDPENYQPISQLNDVWILGDHKLICGDCLDAALIKSIIGDDKVVLVYNDPPYGISILGGSKKTIGDSKNKYKEVLNDKNTDVAAESIMIAKSLDAKIISWGANHYAEAITNSACWIVWDKRRDGHEGKLSFADCELAWTNIDQSALIYRQEWNGCRKQDIFDDDEKHRIHPTQKPVGLAKFCIKKFTKKDDVVLDMFGGSAPTIMACEDLGRRCITFELDPYYIDHVIKRWQKHTAKDAVNLSTGKKFNDTDFESVK